MGRGGDERASEAAPERDVLVCYRGHYRDQVEQLVAELELTGLTVDYDVRILDLVGDPPFADPLGDPDAEERWRAPIREAIRTSELVVFLVPYVNDISQNVWDEVRWVATNARHIFVVFDVRMDLDEEGEALLISSVQRAWMLETVTVDDLTNRTSPSVPEFPYHVVSHEDAEHIDGQIRTLANRVISALDDYRHGRVRWSEATHDLTMSDVRDSPGQRRRRQLHEWQAEAARRWGTEAAEPDRDPLREIVDGLADRERRLVPQGDLLVAPDGFRYPAERERARLVRAQRIAERMRPTASEVPVFFTILSYEAAGVELLLEDRHPTVAATMWGTVPFSTLDLPVFGPARELLFLVDRAFVDLCYQAAKACASTWDLSDGGARAQADAVGSALRADPTPALALVESVRRFGVEGRASSTTDGPPAAELQRPIALLTRFAERYLMAFGYLFAQPDADWTDEDTLAADAATVALGSGQHFDLVDPSIGLQGCVLAEACLALARRSRGDGLDPEELRERYVRRITLLAQRCHQLFVEGGAPDPFATEATQHACDAGSTALVLAEYGGLFDR